LGATTIIGIDCATQPKKCGVARGRFEGGRVVVGEVALGSQIDSLSKTIASWVVEPTLIAIDAPLGWPMALARELAGHAAGQPVGAPPVQGRHLFRAKRTASFPHLRVLDSLIPQSKSGVRGRSPRVPGPLVQFPARAFVATLSSSRSR